MSSAPSHACSGVQCVSKSLGSLPPVHTSTASEFDLIDSTHFQRNVVPYAFGLLRHLKGLPGPLGLFARTSCTAASSRVPSSSADPWPCPCPYPWAATPAPTSPAARRRWSKFWVKAFITNGVILALSFLALGSL